MKKVALIHSEESPTVDAVKYRLKDCTVDCFETEQEGLRAYDLIICTNFNGNIENALRCHHSLLPSFDSKEPEKDAILAGVKVTGITILNGDKIIAQYPVFIKPEMHFEDLKQELNYLEQTFLPIAAEKLLNNEPFDIQSVIGKNSCCSGGCAGCSH